MKKFAFVFAMVLGFATTNEVKAHDCCNGVRLFHSEFVPTFNTFGFVGGTGQVNFFSAPTNAFVRFNSFGFNPFGFNSFNSVNVNVNRGFFGRNVNVNVNRGLNLFSGRTVVRTRTVIR